MSAVVAPTREWSLFIDGRAVAPRAWREVRSPSTGEIVARVGWADRGTAAAAITAAAQAMDSPLPAQTRHDVLRTIAAGLLQRRDELAAIICAEAAKPITAAVKEVDRAAATFRHAADEALHIAGEAVPLAGDGSRRKVAFTLRKPIGVVGAITPFNFPLNLAAHKVAPALAAGCAVVLKPADKAPGVARRLASLAADAGLPAGWFNVVVGPPEEIADALIEDDRVALISFTGSSAIGWQLAARATPKRVTLELGNVTPVLVAADADVAAAAEHIAASGFAFSGQTCISAQHVLVQAEVADTLVADLTARVRALACGDPADPRTEVGPLITEEATQRVMAAIDDARGHGAHVLTGGEVRNGVLVPTLLVDVRADHSLVRAEAFAPLVCISTVTSLDDAIARANATPFGLQAAIFTRSIESAMRAARELRFGAVVVNDSPSFREDQMPYGGVKHSGNTREGPARAIREMTEECLVVLDG